METEKEGEDFHDLNEQVMSGMHALVMRLFLLCYVYF